MTHDQIARETASDCLIVIFGASGDLTRRKLIPALFHLWDQGLAPKNFAVLGVSRTKFTDDEFRTKCHDFQEGHYDDAKWAAFSKRVHYQASDATTSEGWPELTARIDALSAEHKTGRNFLFYLSVGPQYFEPITMNLGACGLITEGKAYCTLNPIGEFQRIVVEKPFGADPKSARHLNNVMASVFDEEDIYRIDHYLGKELVQNLMVIRFANSMFEPLWNQNYIDHVQITASETVGVEGRGGYYDTPSGGAMRDMVQSHLLQVLSLVAMEAPVSLDAQDIRMEKVKVFKALRVPSEADVPKIAVRGQYGQGTVNGKSYCSYRDEDGVAPNSQTDTYAAMCFHVDTWRWGGVPFYLRSGKAMAQKLTEIVVYFKPTPHRLFREQAMERKLNQMVIAIQPDEGVRLRFTGKVPGIGLKIDDVVMDFDYTNHWKVDPPDGYATLLLDAMRGDQTLFKHRDEIEASWNSVQPVLDYWATHPQSDLPNYAAGTWGPPAADLMMEREERYWRNG